MKHSRRLSIKKRSKMSRKKTRLSRKKSLKHKCKCSRRKTGSGLFGKPKDKQLEKERKEAKKIVEQDRKKSIAEHKRAQEFFKAHFRE